jgi:hypothetical protein
MDMETLMKKALSSRDIVFHAKTNLMTYNQLKEYTNLKSILGPYKSCVILYETRDGHGHWCVIFEVNKDRIEFFDPYGLMIDEQLRHISKSYKNKKGLNHTYLIKLIMNSNYKEIEYNNYPLQELKDGINTCGRHVLTRLYNRDMTLDEYYDKIHESGYKPDIYVTLETKNIK